MKPLRVVLLGQSVLLGSLAAGLRRFRELEVLCLAAPPPEAEPVAALSPEVILFDAAAAAPPFALALLHCCPALRLISLDADRNRVVVWSGQQLNDLSLDDLARLLGDDQRLFHLSAVPDSSKDRTS